MCGPIGVSGVNLRRKPAEHREARIKISARNTLHGTVKTITPGAVNTGVILESPGGLVVGKVVYAVVKALNEMIAIA